MSVLAISLIIKKLYPVNLNLISKKTKIRVRITLNVVGLCLINQLYRGAEGNKIL
jgi:hypothetical protein